MTEAEILRLIHDTWLGQTVRDSAWLFPACETLHFIGVCLLLGAMAMVDLRLMGIIKVRPAGSVLKFSHVAAAGLALNVVTGAAFFASNPRNYWDNPLFLAKMALVVVALANVVWFETWERKHVVAAGAEYVASLRAKLIGAMSLMVWISIVILGRLLPILGAG